MHELSIATSIIEQAEEFARKYKAEKITRIDLEVGQFTGVVIDSLKFALEFAVKDTILEKAKVEIIEIKGKTECNACQTIFDNPDWYTPCPACGSMDFKVSGGEELQIKSIYTG